MQINERFLWAVSVIEPAPEEHVLEIGCGAGILAEQIAGRLTSGSLTAIDRSAPMMKLAAKRNEKYIASGKLKLLTKDFAKAALPPQHFDKVVAFNVNFFWKNSARELQLIGEHLLSAGRLFVFYETPSWADGGIEKKIITQLEQNDFRIQDVVHKKSPPCVCVIASAGK